MSSVRSTRTLLSRLWAVSPGCEDVAARCSTAHENVMSRRVVPRHAAYLCMHVYMYIPLSLPTAGLTSGRPGIWGLASAGGALGLADAVRRRLMSGPGHADDS